MKRETKIQFREDWLADRRVEPTENLGDRHLDDMWRFARQKQNQYAGLAEYCLNFDMSILATVTQRAKMRAILEVEVAAPRAMGRLPGAKQADSVRVPAYVGTGTRATGSLLVPLTNAEGEITDEGSRLMLEQALKQMKGHVGRFEAYLPPATAKALQAYAASLQRAADKAAVRAAA